MKQYLLEKTFDPTVQGSGLSVNGLINEAIPLTFSPQVFQAGLSDFTDTIKLFTTTVPSGTSLATGSALYDITNTGGDSGLTLVSAADYGGGSLNFSAPTYMTSGTSSVTDTSATNDTYSTQTGTSGTDVLVDLRTATGNDTFLGGGFGTINTVMGSTAVNASGALPSDTFIGGGGFNFFSGGGGE